MRTYRQIRKVNLIISITLATLLVLSWMTFPKAQEVPRKILKVGALCSLSGPASVWGVGYRGGVEIGVDWVNEKGTKIGGDLYKIELIVEDDKFTAEGGKQAYEKLIYKDGVKFILGPWSSVAVMAGTPSVEENKVLNLCGSFGVKVLSPKYKYLWRPQVTSAEISGAQVAWMKEKFPQVKKAAIIGQNNEYGWTSAADQEVVFKKNDIEVVANVYHEPKIMDYYSILRNMLDKKPDTIASNSAASEIAMQIKQARELGYKGLFLGPTTAPIESWEEIVGKEALEGYIDDTPPLGSDAPKQYQKFRQDYTARHGKFNPAGVQTVNFPLILKQILEKAQSLDPSEIIKTLPGSTYEHTSGRATWGGAARYGTAQNLLYPVGISLYTKGKMVFQGFFSTPEPLPNPRVKRD